MIRPSIRPNRPFCPSRSSSVLLAIAALLLAGCYESTEVTVHEAHEYKGDPDSAMVDGADERAAALRERFNTVQTDR